MSEINLIINKSELRTDNLKLDVIRKQSDTY